MTNSPDLHQALGELAAMLPRQAGPLAEQRLRVAFRTKCRSSRRLQLYCAALAALLLVFGAGSATFRSSHHPAPVPFSAAGFVTLPYGQSDVPIEDAVVLRVDLRPAQLSALGVPVAALPTTPKISADVLVGQDGVPRAVRLVQ